MHTNTFNNASFSETTNDTGEVVALAVRLSERRARDGLRYSKCGVMITGLAPETIRQPALGASWTVRRESEPGKRRVRSMRPCGMMPSASSVPIQGTPARSMEQSTARLDGPLG